MTIMSNQKLTQIYPQRKRRTAHVGKDKQDVVIQPQPTQAGTSKDTKADDLTLLRHFDMNWVYGPCTNITRLERWNRAEKLELDPPTDVKQLIESHLNDKDYTQNVWVDYKL